MATTKIVCVQVGGAPYTASHCYYKHSMLFSVNCGWDCLVNSDMAQLNNL